VKTQPAGEGAQSGKRAGSPVLVISPFPSHSLARAVHFSLVLGNCAGLAAHPTHPPSSEEQSLVRGERQRLPNSHFLDPVKDFGVLEIAEQTYSWQRFPAGTGIV